MNRKKAIFLFPFAGGSSMSFNKWRKHISNYMFFSLNYPKNLASIKELSEILAFEIKKTLEHNRIKKFIFFGHSLGGIVAWETSNVLLKKYNNKPRKIYISSCSAPNIFRFQKHKEYENIESIEKKIKIDNKELKKILARNIYLDYQLIYNYQYNKLKIKKQNIITFSALKDELVKNNEILKWKKFSKIRKNISFNGDHFYIKNEENYKKICRFLNRKI